LPSARLDLHCHSTFSDGLRSPTELVDRALERGLDTLAITDHDTVDGLPEAIEAAGDRLRLVAGVELSTQHGGRGIHLLAWFDDPTAVQGSFSDHLDRRLDGRVARLHRIAEKLSAHGIQLDVDAILAVSGRAVTRGHIGRQLLAQGVVSHYSEAFERWIGEGQPGFVPNDPWPTVDAISFVREHGGLCAVAHPGVNDVTRDEVACFAGAGMQGVEVWHPGHARQTRRRLRRWARDLGLVVTGGSDFHGLVGSDLLGGARGAGIPVTMRAPFLEALAGEGVPTG